MTIETIAATALIMLMAMVARSAFGFGHGAFAMPLLALFLDVKVATPLLAAVSFVTSLPILVQNRRYVRFGPVVGLIIGALCGIPLGVAALLMINERLVLVSLGLVLMAVSARALFGAPLPRLDSDRLAPAFGLAGGVMGGAFNLIGIPVALYGAMRRWTPDEFRISMIGFFFVTTLVSLVGYGVAGLMTSEVLRLGGLMIVPAAAGDVLGLRLGRVMSRQTFERAVWSVVLATSLLLVGRELAG